MNFLVNRNQIKSETEKALLVKVPNSNYCFWVSKKLMKDYKSSLLLYANENYTFKAFYNKSSKEICFDDLRLMFREIDSKYETHIPKKLSAEIVEVPEELKDE